MPLASSALIPLGRPCDGNGGSPLPLLPSESCPPCRPPPAPALSGSLAIPLHSCARGPETHGAQHWNGHPGEVPPHKRCPPCPLPSALICDLAPISGLFGLFCAGPPQKVKHTMLPPALLSIAARAIGGGGWERGVLRALEKRSN